jgi:hypothetical protein
MIKASLTWIPKGIFNRIRQIYFHFLWDGSEDRKPMVLASLNKLEIPKSLGGCEVKKSFLSSKDLAVKRVWRLIQGNDIWAYITKENYFPQDFINYHILDYKDKQVGVKWIHNMEINDQIFPPNR